MLWCNIIKVLSVLNYVLSKTMVYLKIIKLLYSINILALVSLKVTLNKHPVS